MHKFSNVLLGTIALFSVVSCNQNDSNNKSTGTDSEMVSTRLGNLKMESGYPSKETVDKVYEERDFQRACQVHAWALPLVGFHALHLAQQNEIGAKDGSMSLFFDLKDKEGMLTPNITTLYAFCFWNLDKMGPMVVDAPAGLTAGGVLDLWQQPITDIGQTGPDKGAGGKYLILPPSATQTNYPGYRVFKSPTVQVWFGTRGLSPNIKDAEALIRLFNIYALANKDKKTPMEFVPVGGKKWTSAHPTNSDYFKLLSDAIQLEPVQTRDRVTYAMMQSLGIEKGKAFNPDERMKKILDEAAMFGEITARSNAYEKRFKGAKVWEGKHWEFANLVELNQEDSSYTQLDERGSWFYEAIGNSTGMQGRILGYGQAYLETSKDKDGHWLVGSNSYHFHVPANVPAKQFWSITLYDNVTRGPVVTDQGSADMSSRKDMEINPDGSADIYFGPTKPAGANKNYIKTIPGRGWFPYFRFYGPSEGYFNKSWQLNDIELIK